MRRSGREGESYRAVAFGNGLCVAVGSHGGDNILANTADGKTWKTGKHEAKYVKYIRGLAFGDGRFLALGGDPGCVGCSSPFVMFSKDGLAWDGPHAVPGKHMLRRAAWGGGRFVAVGDRGRRATSKDGKEWTDAPGDARHRHAGRRGVRQRSVRGRRFARPPHEERGRLEVERATDR